MDKDRGPLCTECGVDWFRHGGLDHSFEGADPHTPLDERAEDIDDLSRELTEEIEAHRVTRKRAEKAEAERDKARRVAKVLVGPAKHLKILGHDLTADELKAIDTALAYPGREP